MEAAVKQEFGHLPESPVQGQFCEEHHVRGCPVREGVVPSEGPGRRRTHDAGPDVARTFINSDVVYLLTPVTFGGYSSELKKALDRIIGLASPFFVRIDGEFHHKTRYERYPRLVVIGVVWGLVELLVAAVAGAYFYKE